MPSEKLKNVNSTVEIIDVTFIFLPDLVNSIIIKRFCFLSLNKWKQMRLREKHGAASLTFF